MLLSQHRLPSIPQDLGFGGIIPLQAWVGSSLFPLSLWKRIDWIGIQEDVEVASISEKLARHLSYRLRENSKFSHNSTNFGLRQNRVQYQLLEVHNHGVLVVFLWTPCYQALGERSWQRTLYPYNNNSERCLHSINNKLNVRHSVELADVLSSFTLTIWPGWMCSIFVGER